MLALQDMTNAPLASPATIKVSNDNLIQYDYQIQNLSGLNYTNIQASFSFGSALRFGETIPTTLDNNARIAIRLDITPTGILPNETRTYTIEVRDLTEGASVTLLIRVTRSDSSNGQRSRDRSRER